MGIWSVSIVPVETCVFCLIYLDIDVCAVTCVGRHKYLSEHNFLESTLRYSGQQTKQVEKPILPHTKQLVAEVMVMDEEGEDHCCPLHLQAH